jgi:hypothetical protein
MRHLGLLLKFCCGLRNTVTFLMAQERTPLTVTRLYTGMHRLSHFERIRVKFVSVAGEPTTVAESEPVITSKSYFVRSGLFSPIGQLPTRADTSSPSVDAEKFMAQPGEIVWAEELTGEGTYVPGSR